MKLIVWKILLHYFMFLSAVNLVKNSHIYGSIFFIFLENVLKQTWNSFNTNIQPHWKDRKSSYQASIVLGIFLPLNCSKFRLKQCEWP